MNSKSITNRKQTKDAERKAEKERDLLKKGLSKSEILKRREGKYKVALMENETARGMVFPELAKAKVNNFVDDTPYAECLICGAKMAKAVGYDPIDIFKQRPLYAFICKTPGCIFSVSTDENWSAPYSHGYEAPEHIKKQIEEILLEN